ncbi:tetratricopeptide repeat protein [Aliikangiella coralliicola]|uniref:Tetratricopeptide repeat protein n=1 Tax=Aliikangiella coralliicola TaxID=2592383 RepID=A0A545U4Y5_9GAMM|nr:tetratricopeptide repeat protein [Aliikangiella coralliicola]TQV84541.1 tetratricopeptide repeat protein [Aliikangiella coralliicola]
MFIFKRLQMLKNIQFSRFCGIPKSFRLPLAILAFLTISGCAGLLPEEKTQPDQTVAKEQVDEEQPADAAGAEQDATKVAAITKPDPMKEKVAPLELVKGYGAINQLIKGKKTGDAIAKLQQLQTTHPEQSGPSYRMARLYMQQKQFEEALKAVNESIKIDPQNYYAHNLKGVVLRELGSFDKAKEAYVTAIDLYPGYPNSHLNLGILADIYLYDLGLAQQHYQAYLDLIGTEDKKVSGWVLDLQRRIQRGN